MSGYSRRDDDRSSDRRDQGLGYSRESLSGYYGRDGRDRDSSRVPSSSSAPYNYYGCSRCAKTDHLIEDCPIARKEAGEQKQARRPKSPPFEQYQSQSTREHEFERSSGSRRETERRHLERSFDGQDDLPIPQTTQSEAAQSATAGFDLASLLQNERVKNILLAGINKATEKLESKTSTDNIETDVTQETIYKMSSSSSTYSKAAVEEEKEKSRYPLETIEKALKMMNERDDLSKQSGRRTQGDYSKEHQQYSHHQGDDSWLQRKSETYSGQQKDIVPGFDRNYDLYGRESSEKDVSKGYPMTHPGQSFIPGLEVEPDPFASRRQDSVPGLSRESNFWESQSDIYPSRQRDAVPGFERESNILERKSDVYSDRQRDVIPKSTREADFYTREKSDDTHDSLFQQWRETLNDPSNISRSGKEMEYKSSMQNVSKHKSDVLKKDTRRQERGDRIHELFHEISHPKTDSLHRDKTDSLHREQYSQKVQEKEQNPDSYGVNDVLQSVGFDFGFSKRVQEIIAQKLKQQEIESKKERAAEDFASLLHSTDSRNTETQSRQSELKDIFAKVLGGRGASSERQETRFPRDLGELEQSHPASSGIGYEKLLNDLEERISKRITGKAKQEYYYPENEDSPSIPFTASKKKSNSGESDIKNLANLIKQGALSGDAVKTVAKMIDKDKTGGNVKSKTKGKLSKSKQAANQSNKNLPDKNVSQNIRELRKRALSPTEFDPKEKTVSDIPTSKAEDPKPPEAKLIKGDPQSAAVSKISDPNLASLYEKVKKKLNTAQLHSGKHTIVLSQEPRKSSHPNKETAHTKAMPVNQKRNDGAPLRSRSRDRQRSRSRERQRSRSRERQRSRSRERQGSKGSDRRRSKSPESRRPQSRRRTRSRSRSRERMRSPEQRDSRDRKRRSLSRSVSPPQKKPVGFNVSDNIIRSVSPPQKKKPVGFKVSDNMITIKTQTQNNLSGKNEAKAIPVLSQKVLQQAKIKQQEAIQVLAQGGQWSLLVATDE